MHLMLSLVSRNKTEWIRAKLIENGIWGCRISIPFLDMKWTNACKMNETSIQSDSVFATSFRTAQFGMLWSILVGISTKHYLGQHRPQTGPNRPEPCWIILYCLALPKTGVHIVLYQSILPCFGCTMIKSVKKALEAKYRVLYHMKLVTYMQIIIKSSISILHGKCH